MRRRQRSRKATQDKATAAAAVENDPKLTGVYGGEEFPGQGKGGKPGQAVMDTAMRLQSTGGANSYQGEGPASTCSAGSPNLLQM